MIYTIKEYAKKFQFGGKFVSYETVRRRCKDGMLPMGHIVRKLAGKTGSWVIEVTNNSDK